MKSSTARAEEASSAQHKAELSLRTAREERDAAVARADLRQQDVDRLSSELASRNELLNSATARENELVSELASVRASLGPVEREAARLREERELWAKQKKWYDAELEAKSHALLEVRKSAAARESELHVAVESAKGQAAGHERRATDLDRELTLLKAQHSSLAASSKEAEVRAATLRGSLEGQIDQTAKLANLYKERSETASARVRQLEAAVEEGRADAEARLAAAREEAAAQLTRLREEAGEEVRRLRAALAERDAAVAQLQAAAAEAEARAAAAAAKAAESPATRVLAALEADMSSGGALAHTALQLLSKASTGAGANGIRGSGVGDISATALYARVEAAESALSKEKEECAKVKACLARVLAEVEAKTPLMDALRRDYERTVVAHQELEKRMAAALRDAAEARRVAGEEREARGRAEEAAAQAAAQVRDLTTQVRSLLQHAADGADAGAGAGVGAGAGAGGKVAWPASDEALVAAIVDGGASGSPSDADPQPLIDEQLVAFKDVAELQSRNAQLLRVLRQVVRQAGTSLSRSVLLSGRTPAGKGNAAAAAAASGSGSLLGASGLGGSAAEALRGMMSELQELRSVRERQASMVSLVVQQRDLFRLRLQQVDPAAARAVDTAAGLGRSGVGAGAGAGGAAAPGTPAALQFDGTASAASAAAALSASQLGAPAQSPLPLAALRSPSASSAGGAAAATGGYDASMSQLIATTQANSAALASQLDAAREEVGRVREQAVAAQRAADELVGKLRDEITALRVEVSQTKFAGQNAAEKAQWLASALEAAKADGATAEKQHHELQVSRHCAVVYTCLCCCVAVLLILFIRSSPFPVVAGAGSAVGEEPCGP